MTESDLEEIGGERTEIILKTNENKCRVCDLGDIVHVKRDKESILIYTRELMKIVDATIVHCLAALVTFMDTCH